MELIGFSLSLARKMYGKIPELDEKLRGAFSLEDLTSPEPPKKYRDLKSVGGYNILGYPVNFNFKSPAANSSSAEEDANLDPVIKSTFIDRWHARSSYAAAQLSQLMNAYNNGWKPDWTNSNQNKYCIARYGNGIEYKTYNTRWCFLAFSTEALREEFFGCYRELINDYYMLS